MFVSERKKKDHFAIEFHFNRKSAYNKINLTIVSVKFWNKYLLRIAQKKLNLLVTIINLFGVFDGK